MSLQSRREMKTPDQELCRGDEKTEKETEFSISGAWACLSAGRREKDCTFPKALWWSLFPFFFGMPDLSFRAKPAPMPLSSETGWLKAHGIGCTPSTQGAGDFTLRDQMAWI